MSNGIQKLILGTVQFGVDYGINNKAGQTPEAEAFGILELAGRHHITLLDTAQAYGNAQTIISRYNGTGKESLQVISKLKIENGKSIPGTTQSILDELGIKKLYGLLLHDERQLLLPGIEEAFKDLKEKGLIQYSGISVYTNEQFEKAMNTDFTDIIQLPYNLLDNINNRGRLLQAAAEKNKIIHTRSVFLQGLFFMQPQNLPPGLQPLAPYLKALHAVQVKYNTTMEALALQYVLRNKWISGVLIGVDSVAQLENNIAAVSARVPAEAFDAIDEIRVHDNALLNPVNWK